jgi:hypothetical protein
MLPPRRHIVVSVEAVIMARKYSRSASKDVKREMHKYKRGKLKSGSGRKVKSRKQAIAIGLSEARKKGKKVPKRKKRQ